MGKNYKKDYFNKVECSKLVKLVHTDLMGAKAGFEQYLEIYPKDYYAKVIYASVLITLHQFDLACQIIDEVELGFSRDRHLIRNTQRHVENEKDVIFCKVRLLSYTDHIEELYKFVFFHRTQLVSLNMYDFLLFYCKSKLGILSVKRDEENSYLFRQIIEYREEDMIDHIKDHLAYYNPTMEKPDSNVFVPDFPISSVIEEVKKIIPNEKRLCHGIIDDIYVFKYDFCGRDNNRVTNFFKVVCFHDTCNIITMFPIYGVEKLPYIDLNYLVCNEDVPVKTKVLSQRDKFNKRYGLK